ncbi:hypothetical protein GQ457_12G021160 [Hibiscus cannabinus]
MVNQQVPRGRTRIWGAALLCWLFIMLVTPKIPLSYNNHLYADMRNFVVKKLEKIVHGLLIYLDFKVGEDMDFVLCFAIGVPNTLNVITNFPFLIVGVLGFVLCLGGGSFFNIRLPGELWGWLLFYGGIASVAFGSAYFHLRPDDNRVLLDTLPMMIACSSLFSSFILERLGERIGLSCLFSLLVLAVLSAVYARTFNDLRLCMTFQFIPCMAIPIMTFLFPPKYTHSRYWLWTVGVCILAKMEALADMKIYQATNYIISGHSLEHLCSAIAPVLITVMLVHRSCRFPSHDRLGEIKECP